MSYRVALASTFVLGIIFIVLVYNFVSDGLAVSFATVAIIFTVAGLVIYKAFHRTDSFVEQYGEADILYRLWFPLQDELSDVLRTGGRVTESSSSWSTAPGISKRETPATFYSGMEQYVGQRELVATLGASKLAAHDGRQQLKEERVKLLFMARDLVKEVNREIDTIPSATTAVRRSRSTRHRPSAQRMRNATTGPYAGSGAETRQPTPVSINAQTQAATSARTVSVRQAPSRAALAPMRIAETSTNTNASRPRSTPLRIADTPAPPEPTVAPVALREPVPPPPPSVPPVPFPTTASIPEPVVDAPIPSVSKPASQPSSPPNDLRLDVASVCEDLFNSSMMSYATNRMFDDRYKDATVRWKGTARRANVYSYDFNFGDGGGTKAELDVYEVKQQYGSRTVKAVVQMPVEAANVLGARIGEDIEFEGRLMTCEGSARRLYVADARMVD